MFKPKSFDTLRRRTGEYNACLRGSSRKVGILRQESVSGYDGVDIVPFRNVYNLVSVLYSQTTCHSVIIVK